MKSMASGMHCTRACIMGVVGAQARGPSVPSGNSPVSPPFGFTMKDASQRWRIASGSNSPKAASCAAPSGLTSLSCSPIA